jgi:hypothetical protein
MTITTAIGGAIGLLALIGFVKWLLRTDPGEKRESRRCSSFRCGRLLVVLGLLIRRKSGLRLTGSKRVAQR